MSLSIVHIVSIVGTLVLIMGLGVASGRRVKSAADFATGGKSAGGLMVAGIITGTLVGGSSTIGTAELGGQFGFSAWWFTLGASAGCLLLAFIYAKPVRGSECTTIQQIISREYGKGAELATSILTCLGMILNVVAQILAANALLGSMFGLSSLWCSVISVVIMACFVLFGGIKSSGLLGLIKLGLLYGAAAGCGLLALSMQGGLGGFAEALPGEQYLNLFARGAGKDLGVGASVLLGVISTQTYIQATLAGRSNREAVRGCLISAALIPPVGFFCLLVGMYMHLNFPQLAAAEALPGFILAYLPAPLAGVALATLLIAVVGSGSGMALGFGTIIGNDVYKGFVNRNADSRQLLLVTRGAILGLLLGAALFTFGNLGSAILLWGSLGMGLRAGVLLAPMTAALFWPGRVRPQAAIASSVAGVLLTVAGQFIPLPFDPLFLGMAAAVFCMLLGIKPRAAV